MYAFRGILSVAFVVAVPLGCARFHEAAGHVSAVGGMASIMAAGAVVVAGLVGAWR